MLITCDTRLLTFTIAKCRKFEVLAFLESGNFPAFLECRKFSCISGVPEIFLHFWSAGNFPAFLECRKFSCISGVPEIFLHFWSAGNFPAFLECRKFSGISGVPEIFLHFNISCQLQYISILSITFAVHLFLHFSVFLFA